MRHSVGLIAGNDGINPVKGDLTGLKMGSIHMAAQQANNPMSQMLSGGFRRSQTINAFKLQSRAKEQIDDLVDAEEVVKRMKQNHIRRVGKQTDLYETLPLFKHIKVKKDRDNLKAAFIEERYKAGEIIFNYSKQSD